MIKISAFSPTLGNNLVLTVAHWRLPARCYMIYTVPLICDPICTMQMSSDSSLFLSLKQTMAPVTKKEISNRRKLFSLFLFLCLYFFFLVLGLTVSNYPEIFTNFFPLPNCFTHPSGQLNMSNIIALLKDLTLKNKNHYQPGKKHFPCFFLIYVPLYPYTHKQTIKYILLVLRSF